MHLLGHLLVSFLFLLCGAFILDCLYSFLITHISVAHVICRYLWFSRTCLSASFSSFISFSLALVADVDIRNFVRCSYEVNPELGRNALRGACHCLPEELSVSINQATEIYKFGSNTIPAHALRLLLRIGCGGCRRLTRHDELPDKGVSRSMEDDGGSKG